MSDETKNDPAPNEPVVDRRGMFRHAVGAAAATAAAVGFGAPTQAADEPGPLQSPDPRRLSASRRTPTAAGRASA